MKFSVRKYYRKVIKIFPRLNIFFFFSWSTVWTSKGPCMKETKLSLDFTGLVNAPVLKKPS